jgi:hypothetical protein
MLFLSNHSCSVLFSDHLFRIPRLTSQLCHFIAIDLPNNIAGQALLARLHELLGLFLIQALGNPFAAACLRNAILAASSGVLLLVADIHGGTTVTPTARRMVIITAVVTLALAALLRTPLSLLVPTPRLSEHANTGSGESNEQAP